MTRHSAIHQQTGYEAYAQRRQAEIAAINAASLPESSPFAGASAELRAKVSARVDALLPRLKDLARSLYDEPEIAFQEHKSVRKLAAVLQEIGFSARVGAFGVETALHAHAGSKDGPQFAFVSEYDALPGLGHACGHNLIAAIGLGGFLAAASVIEELGGGVHLIGTPAEEGGAGKQYVIDGGGFNGIDAAAMVHPGNGDRAFGRSVGLRQIEVTYHGRASHAGSNPHLGLNALDGVVAGYQAVAYLRQHILPTDRVHGIITDGGQAANIVPERAAAQYFVRSADVDTLELLVRRVVAALEGAAQATGTFAQIKIDVVPAYLPMVHSDPLLTRFVSNLEGRRTFPARASAIVGSGSTDMGNVSQILPSIHPVLKVSPADVVVHTAAFPDYTISPAGDEAIRDGALGLALTGIDFLADAEFRAETKRQFDLGRI